LSVAKQRELVLNIVEARFCNALNLVARPLVLQT